MDVRKLIQQLMQYDMDFPVYIVVDDEYKETCYTTKTMNECGQTLIEIKLL